MSIRVLVVESHPTVRAVLRALFGCCADVQLVGEVANHAQALVQAAELRPDIVLLDVAKSGQDSVALGKRITDEVQGTKVILMSLDPHGTELQLARQFGLSGYLLKNLAEELEPALRAVAGGNTYYTPAATLMPVSAMGPRKVTPRQKQVMELIARGFTTKEISQQLGVSFKTIQTHRTELMARLDLHDVAGVVRYAIRNGLATAEE